MRWQFKLLVPYSTFVRGRSFRSGCGFVYQSRAFSGSPALRAERAIVYTRTGNPTCVLTSVSFPVLPPPPLHTVNVKFLLSTVNPADINVIEGVYPSKPSPNTMVLSTFKNKDQPVFVAGNEGLGEITAVGKDVTELRKGDWVIVTKEQAGTWASSANLDVHDVLRIPQGEHITQVHGATIRVNPTTAYVMLRDFVDLNKGDWVLQNGANSSVGQAVIQIAASRGLRTINLVRDRPGIEALEKQLEDLGADHVVTYEELLDPSFPQRIKNWTNDGIIRLGLNCIGGKDTSLMAKLLGRDAHLVSYGAMAKQPLILPTSLLIFRNLTCHGFWLSRWYRERSHLERQRLLHTLLELINEGKVGVNALPAGDPLMNKVQMKEPEHQIVTLGAHESDQNITQKVRDVISEIGQGRYGRKVLWRIEGTAD